MNETPSGQQSGTGFGRGMILGAWVLFLILLTLLFSGWLQKQSNPNRTLVVAKEATGELVVSLQRNRAGHYLAPGKVNGEEVSFILDTGATKVALPQAVASRAGLKRGLRSQSMTASGVVDVWMTRVDRLRLGPFEMVDVPAVIIPDMPGDEVLLGMSFLKHLRLEQEDGRLKISLPD
jgi:aspartyl protease family protein